MTDSPTSENQVVKDKVHPPLWLKLLRRTAISLGLVIIVTTAAGATWLWFFVNNDLGPLVEKELSKLIDRPVKIGSIEKVYLTGLRVGLSTLPATESDPYFAEIPTVKVGFNPLTLLLTNTLYLKIALLEPTFYIEQEVKVDWLQLKLQKVSERSKTLNINIKTVEVQNGKVILFANGERISNLFEIDEPMVLKPVVLHHVQLKAKIFNNKTETKYQVTAQPTSGGYLKIKGKSNLSSFDTELYLKGDSLAATEVMPLIPNLPLSLESGELNFSLGLNLQETTVLSWQGKAKFSNVNGKVGTLAQPISQASGQLKFADRRVSVENTQGFYGELPLKVNGTIDNISDYNLAISIPPLNLDHYINTMELTLPIPVGGEARTELQVTGSLLSPILSGMVVSTQPAKVDLIDIAAAKARFRLEGKELEITEIEAEPVLGGFIYGRGRIQLTEIPELGVYLLAENLPVDAIAELYSGEKPPINIGRINGSATVLGQVDKPTTLVKWRSPEAMYPGSGELTITKETIFAKNTVFQVAGGTVGVTGSMVAEKNRWQAFLNAKNIELSQLTSSTTNPSEIRAILAGGLRLSGQLTSFAPADIQGLGELQLTTADATVTGRGTLDKGQWRISLGVETLPGKALRLHELAPDLPLPMELGSGTLELSGTVDSFDRKNIDRTGIFWGKLPQIHQEDK